MKNIYFFHKKWLKKILNNKWGKGQKCLNKRKYKITFLGYREKLKNIKLSSN